MTSTKAQAGSLSALLGTIVSWGLTKLPFWAAMPDDVQKACYALVVMGVGYAIVYLAPANQHTVDVPAPVPHADHASI